MLETICKQSGTLNNLRKLILKNNKLAKEDKIAIAVAILAFLTISVLMTRDGYKRQQQTNNIENATKANTPVTKTAVDFFKAKQR